MKMDPLPVKYSGQKKAWMDTSLFHDWFHNNFLMSIRNFDLLVLRRGLYLFLITVQCRRFG
jgi:hypothetical protein